MTAWFNRRPAELRIGGGHASLPPIATMDQPRRAGPGWIMSMPARTIAAA